MQKVIYEDPQGRSVTFSPYSPPYIFESVNGIGGLDANVFSVNPVGMHGSVYQGNRLEDREITLNLHIYGDTREELYKNRQALMNLVSPTISTDGSLGRLMYENDWGSWWIPAVVKKAPQNISKRLSNYLTYQIVWHCPDPFWRDMTVTIETLAYLGGGFKFQLTIPAINQAQPGVRFGDKGYQAVAYNLGDAYTPIEVEITGPALKPKVLHKDTGEFIEINRELNAGDILTINTEPGNKSVSITRATGERESAMQYIAPGSKFFQLHPGENFLEYTSGDESTAAKIKVIFWSRHGGV